VPWLVELQQGSFASQLGGTRPDMAVRAVQLNPNQPALYILAASHELGHQSPSTARTLLQRGIRLNPESIELWREYVRMELGFIESLRRRWDVLGINAGDKGKGKAHDDDDAEGIDEEQDDDTGAASRHEIMQGAIVKSVLSSAVQGTVGLYIL
jgi:U3 small nucleolar RNA-associated protein 6